MKKTGFIGYQLRELMKSGDIASVFTDPENPDDFIAGYVRAISARSALIESIGPFGYFDGWFALKLGCVLDVQFDAAYAERLNRLLKINAQQPQSLDMPDEAHQADCDYIALLMRCAMAQRRAVTVWTASDAYTGFVGDVNDLHMSLIPLGFLGERFDAMPLRLTDVELSSMGSEEERMYEKLSASITPWNL